MKAVTRTLLVLGLVGTALGAAHAASHKGESLPPGLEKNVQAGKSLPPGWEKKLSVGHRLDHEVYEQATIMEADDGLLTINVEGKLIQIMENTHEIVEILGSL